MKITFTSNHPYPVCEIYEENRKIIHIKIDPETQAFRIMCCDSQRVFFVEHEVIKKTEITTLLNEYSQQLGFLTKNKMDTNIGQIEIEGAQYTYKLNDDTLKEINLFEYDNYQPVLNCKLETGKSTFLNNEYISYLLFALVWFLFLTKEHATLVQFAEA